MQGSGGAGEQGSGRPRGHGDTARGRRCQKPWWMRRGWPRGWGAPGAAWSRGTARGPAPTRGGGPRYCGHRDGRLLDGGKPRWVRDGRPLTKEVPSVKPITYAPTPPDPG